MLKKLIAESAAKSPWVYHINTGSCNGCDIELVAAVTPRFDAERFGVKLAGTPRHADIVVVTGPVTAQSKERLIRTLEQVPEPRVIVAMGSCPNSCNVFKNSYAVEGPLDKYCHVDVTIYLLHHRFRMNFYLAKLFATGVVTFWNFFMNYFFTFL